MGSARPKVRTGLGYLLSTLIMGILPIALIPVAVSIAGADGWARAAVGQSIGSLGSVIVAWGWAFTGPAEVAAATRQSRSRILVDSIHARSAVSAPVVVAIIAITYVMAAGDMSSVLLAVASLFAGLSCSWYYVGQSDPTALFVRETLPKVFASVLALAVALIASSLVAYGAVLLIGNLLVCLLAVGYAGAWNMLVVPPSLRHVVGSLRSRSSVFSASAIGTIYVSLPLPLVSLLAPDAVAAFAALLRVYRFLVQLFGPVTQVLQGWVPQATGGSLRSRTYTAVTVSSIAGLLSGGAVAVVGRPALEVLGGGLFETSILSLVFAGVAALATTVSRTTGLACLPAWGGFRWVLRSMLAGAVGSVMVFLVAIPVFGGDGAWLGIAVAECVVLLVQLVGLRRLWRNA